MRIFKLLVGLPLIYILFILISGVPFTGCTKTKTVHDTTTVVIKDTINTKDTITIRDTINTCTYDLSKGLIAYYNFNGGNLNDSSGLHNNIVFNNATKTTDRFGNSNNAYLFDGVSSYMQIKNSTSLNPDSITLFAILKVNGFYAGPCGGNAIITKGDDYAANGFYGMNFLDPTSNCGATNFNNEYFAGSYGNDIPIGSDAFLFADTVLVKTSTWYYITYTYDRGTAKMYINGQLKNTRQIAVGFNQNPYDLFLGKVNNVSFPYYFKGVIDEIRIYNRALCSGAVTQLNNVKE